MRLLSGLYTHLCRDRGVVLYLTILERGLSDLSEEKKGSVRLESSQSFISMMKVIDVLEAFGEGGVGGKGARRWEWR